jgi:hypothetical protein
VTLRHHLRIGLGQSADGKYRIALAPGEYTLVVVTDTFPLCPETPVSVKSGLFTTADISCDTGIR